MSSINDLSSIELNSNFALHEFITVYKKIISELVGAVELASEDLRDALHTIPASSDVSASSRAAKVVIHMDAAGRELVYSMRDMAKTIAAFEQAYEAEIEAVRGKAEPKKFDIA